MSNTVSTEATLFSTTHPDVVKRTSVSSIIISAILCVIGCGCICNLFKDGGFLIHHEHGAYGWWNHFVSVGRIPLFLARQGMGVCTYRQRS